MPYQGPAQLSFQSAIVTVTFGVLDWAALPQDDPAGEQGIDPATPFLYASQDITYGAEYQTLPGSALQVTYQGPGGVTTTKPMNKDANVKISNAEMSITLHRLPYFPTNFLPFIDNVNVATFLGCNRGMVRFNGGKTKREAQSDGSISQSVEMSFSYRPQYEWNMIPNPYNNVAGIPLDWAYLQYKSGRYVFLYNDLSQVFPSGYIY